MSKISFELQERLSSILRMGDLAQCECIVVGRLHDLPESPFHAILDLSIKTTPSDVAEYFDEFFRNQQALGKIKAAYTEMNGFDINPELWFCSPFAYKRYGGREDYDWLSDWHSGEFGYLPITGLEPLQKVYAGAAFSEKRFEDACSVASLLVVIRFQDLIRRAASHMQELRFPLLATAHNYDFIYETRRSG